jgi:hypothetical protein
MNTNETFSEEDCLVAYSTLALSANVSSLSMCKHNDATPAPH